MLPPRPRPRQVVIAYPDLEGHYCKKWFVAEELSGSSWVDALTQAFGSTPPKIFPDEVTTQVGGKYDGGMYLYTPLRIPSLLAHHPVNMDDKDLWRIRAGDSDSLSICFPRSEADKKLIARESISSQLSQYTNEDYEQAVSAVELATQIQYTASTIFFVARPLACFGSVAKPFKNTMLYYQENYVVDVLCLAKEFAADKTSCSTTANPNPKPDLNPEDEKSNNDRDDLQNGYNPRFNAMIAKLSHYRLSVRAENSVKRAEAYGILSVVASILGSAATSIMVASQSERADVQFTEALNVAETLAVATLAAIIFSISVLSMQQHKIQRMHRMDASDGEIVKMWDSLHFIRTIAVISLFTSLPLLLVSAGAFSVSDVDVHALDWLSMACAIYATLICAYCMYYMNRVFNQASPESLGKFIDPALSFSPNSNTSQLHKPSPSSIQNSIPTVHLI